MHKIQIEKVKKEDIENTKKKKNKLNRAPDNDFCIKKRNRLP